MRFLLRSLDEVVRGSVLSYLGRVKNTVSCGDSNRVPYFVELPNLINPN